MIGSNAQDLKAKGSGKAEASGRGASSWPLGAGYQMKPTNDKGRSSMTARRTGGEGREIRLGTLQVVIWLGLALGSIFGAYGLGFVSGKAVGFESARNSSGSEVAKLAVTDIIPDKNEQSPSGIYDRLSAPAVLKQEGGAEKSGTASAGNAPTKPVRDITAEKVKEIQDAQKAAEAESSLQEIENIFADDTSSEAALADAKNVRMLGGESAKPVPVIIGEDATSNDKKTVGSLIDERLGATQPSGAAVALEEQGAGKVLGQGAQAQAGTTSTTTSTTTTPAKAAPPAEPPASRVVITKKPKAGYYAQVNAPDSSAEAEKIAKKLQGSGFPVVIESASTKGKTFYRVLVGPEQNKVQAERLLGQLKGEKYIKGSPFIKSVK